MNETNNKIKFKIFFGTYGSMSSISADVKINNWLEEHPNIDIWSIHYSQATYNNHSICVSYMER